MKAVDNSLSIEKSLLDLLKPSEEDSKVRHPSMIVNSKYLIE
jgi:hypothetical protein